MRALVLGPWGLVATSTLDVKVGTFNVDATATFEVLEQLRELAILVQFFRPEEDNFSVYQDLVGRCGIVCVCGMFL